MSELFSLPKIETKRKLTPAKDRGAPGELEWIPIGKLFIDRSYQRPINSKGTANIARIVENFSWSCFSPLVVAPRGGDRYAVIDGQHRAVAAKAHGGIGTLPCLVIRCTPDQEATAFVTINGDVTRVQTQYMFRARLSGKDARAVAADRAARAAGVEILPYPVDSKSIKPRQTLACGTIERCVRLYGEAATSSALRLIVESDDSPGLLRSQLISGFARALAASPGAQRRIPTLIEIVRARGLRKIMDEAFEKALGSGSGAGAHFHNRLAAIITTKLGMEPKPIAAPQESAPAKQPVPQSKPAANFNSAKPKTPSRPSSPGTA